MKVLRSQKMVQKKVTGFTGNKYNSVSDEVVGNFAVLIQLNGCVCAGVGETEKLAIENAKQKLK